MPLDSFAVRAETAYLRRKLTGGKINKITQPEKEEISLFIYNKGENFRLVLNSFVPCFYVGGSAKQTPLNAPQFCMTLRKHLSGGTITEIEQLPYERVVILSIKSVNDFFDDAYYKLIFEVMGRQSNIILCDGQYKVVGAVKYMPLDSARPLLSNMKYSPPPNNRASIESEEAKKALEDYDGDAARFVISNYMGFSLPSAEYLLNGIAENRFAEQFDIFVNNVKEFNKKIDGFEITPYIALHDGKPAVFFLFAPKDFADVRRYDDINECLSAFYTARQNLKSIESLKKAVLSAAAAQIKKIEKKAAIQKEILLQAEQAEKYRIYGELLTANLHNIKQGQIAVVENYYDENKPLQIKLDERLSPSKNAQRYFEKYAKIKKAISYAEKQLKEFEEELSYLYSIVDYADAARTEEELEQIRQELSQQKTSGKDKTETNKKTAQVKPHISSQEIDGFTVFWGRNNTQNDYVTFKLARPDDIWLHAKAAHGPHVIIRTEGKTPPDNVLYKAAQIAANLNKTFGAEVDYTYKKHVKKPPGAKPGFVTYANYKTIFVKYDNNSLT